jgi:hypothetical protein
MGRSFLLACDSLLVVPVFGRNCLEMLIDASQLRIFVTEDVPIHLLAVKLTFSTTDSTPDR